MANQRQVKRRIGTAQNISKITKAMEMVAASKMKKAQDQALAARPYSQALYDSITTISKASKVSGHPLLSNHEEGIPVVLVIGTDKGLCGAFNFNLFRFLLKNFDIENNEFITVGKKGAIFITKLGGKILADFSSPPLVDYVSPIFQTALSNFLKEEYKSVYLVYNQFISSLRFESIKFCLLPLKMKKEQIETVKKALPDKEYLIEPKSMEMLEALLKSYLEEKIRGAILESEAAEHSARMIAMKNATDNAQEVIYDLILLRNKVRQEKITYELLDMITAKESIQ